MKKCRGKITYETLEIAEKNLEGIRKAKTNTKKPIRAYKCDVCPFFHLTSKPDEKVKSSLIFKKAFKQFLHGSIDNPDIQQA